MAGKNRRKLGIGHPDMSRFVKKSGRPPRSRPDFCRDIIPLEILSPSRYYPPRDISPMADSNQGPLVSEATALPTEPQPPPKYVDLPRFQMYYQRRRRPLWFQPMKKPRRIRIFELDT